MEEVSSEQNLAGLRTNTLRLDRLEKLRIWWGTGRNMTCGDEYTARELDEQDGAPRC